MLRNFTICLHCTTKRWPGVLTRVHHDIPKVTRSDGSTFHLALFDGPSVPCAQSGGVLANSLIADFRYVHDEFSESNDSVTVLLSDPDKKDERIADQLEKIADQLAQMLSEGIAPAKRYEFDGNMLRCTHG